METKHITNCYTFIFKTLKLVVIIIIIVKIIIAIITETNGKLYFRIQGYVTTLLSKIIIVKKVFIFFFKIRAVKKRKRK